MSRIDGPRLKAASGRADALVVLLHGYGADGDDLIELGRMWQGQMPNAAFVAPHAPDLIPGFPPGMGGGRQWFALDSYDPNLLRRDPKHTAEIYATMAAAAAKSAAPLNAFIDAELAKLGLTGERLALAGFSQGTMMALDVGLQRSVAPAGILGFSGALLGGATLKERLRHCPPILLVHGDADDIVPIEAMHAALQALSDAGCPARFHISRGTGHGIAADGLDLGGGFLAGCLGA